MISQYPRSLSNIAKLMQLDCETEIAEVNLLNW